MLGTKRMRFPIDVILVCIRWYAAYPLSYRHLEEMMRERGVFVDHSSINRWAIGFLPLLEKVFRKHKRPVGGSWRMDETYIKIKGAWKYLYRAVDKEGKTIDFLLTAKRDKTAAMRFFDKAMQDNGMPEKVTMDKSGANKSAIDQIIGDKDYPSSCGRSSTSKTSSNKTIAPSNASRARCRAFNLFAQPKMFWPELNSCI